MKVDFHPSAVEELEESADWYAARSIEAAQKLLVAVDVALGKIAEQPERFPQVDASHRACSLEKFPFQIVFRYEKERLLVIAVAHAKRRPRYWKKRK